MTKTRIKFRNPEESKEIQAFCFKLGYVWAGDTYAEFEKLFYHAGYIYLDSIYGKSVLMYSSLDHEGRDYTELTFQELQSLLLQSRLDKIKELTL